MKRPPLSGVRAVASLLLAGLACASCSTSSGSSYSSSVSGEVAAARAARAARAAQGEAQAAKPGSGHSGGSYNQAPDGDSQAASFILDLIVAAAQYASSGTIQVPSLPAGLGLTIDGSAHAPGSILIPQGSHVVRVEGFGYLPWASTVTVVMGRTVTVSPELRPAPFSLGSVAADPVLFDPKAPGRLGRARISFKVTAPGTARVEILDKGGRAVFESDELDLTGPEGKVFWEGLSPKDRGLEAGDYRIRVRARAESGEELEAWGSLSLVETRAGTTASSMAGFSSGALYAPDARVLPWGHLEVSLGAYAVFDPAISGAARLPLFAGFRMGLPVIRSEVSLSVLDVGYSGYDFGDLADWASGSLAMKTQLAGDDIAALSLLLGGSWGSYFSSDAPPSWDGPSRFPGFSAGLILEYDSTIARLFATLQGEASNYYPGYTATAVDSGTVPGLFTWLYLRGGIDLLLPDFLGSQGDLALSAAARTSPFQSGLSFTAPLSIGAELHWYLPHSPAVLSVLASGEWSGKDDWYLGGGLGLGFLF